MWLPLACPQLGTWPATQACALTGNQTGDPLVHRPVLNPLSHTSQGYVATLDFLVTKVYLLTSHYESCHLPNPHPHAHTSHPPTIVRSSFCGVLYSMSTCYDLNDTYSSAIWYIKDYFSILKQSYQHPNPTLSV